MLESLRPRLKLPARPPLPSPRRRRDHAASAARQRSARQLHDDACADEASLTRAVHEARAAKEEAERALGAAIGMADQLRGDWVAKLRDRRREVRRRRAGGACCSFAALLRWA